MGDIQGQEVDIINQIDWENLLDNIPEDLNLFADDLPLVTDSPVDDSTKQFSNPSPDSVSSWIGEIEQLLMEEDDKEVKVNPDFCDEFFSDLFIDVPVDPSGEARVSNDVISWNPESNDSDNSQEKEKSDVSDVKNGGEDEDEDDPVSKKRKRQLRNKDAALRSRERKKTYVRDLEMKSRYLEGECRRLDRLLQCFIAENQALHFRVEKDKAFDASMAKQESAVLLLESLLLGSLLWFTGIMCLFSLPGLLHSTTGGVPLGNVGSEDQVLVALRGAGNERLGLPVLRMFFKSKRCKALRTKMKLKMSFQFGMRDFSSFLFLIFPFSSLFFPTLFRVMAVREECLNF
ncbi:hypothetical protein HHK36_002384 [Tetracentron sinense]|uniref:BZIP domain-containing protein n=1 Tax=Tetracentron sinense TaxID=13715 RepID=A0A834ZVE5_TETSI|nr:hypothetical protein HHK36_002384 [Tetracentron sinense]